MIIAELGASGTTEYQQEWLGGAVSALPDFPEIKVICYYNEVNAPNNHMPTQPDWRIPPSVFAEFPRALQPTPTD